ncbi:hypothetical protein Cgig2_008459 [Carnegiea gigantea]|uniref:DUF547 domain-containing protein n=1 Tax=Carnegiea gigantea TaxID=171969 RepID=A0A9Q1Q6E1_9CARY|nr:hypothetical protein Cgig2_008459 [Carnegiea gigantea]
MEKEPKLERQGSPGMQKASSLGSQTTREKKLALLQDVDRLKKKLRDEENIHRALLRAFYRPRGSLPRLPPYLPPNTQELLAEIAVLEEEVGRLEEQVATYRANLYQEAIYICSKRKLESPMDYYERVLSKATKDEQSDSEESPLSVARTISALSDAVSDRSSLSLARTASASSDVVSGEIEQRSTELINAKQALGNCCSLETGKGQGNPTPKQNSDSVSSTDPSSSGGLISGKETEPSSRGGLISRKSDDPSSSNESLGYGTGKDKDQTPGSSERKLSRMKTPVRKSSFKRQPSPKSSARKQLENKALGGDSEPNKISEDLLKCLCSIFMRISTKNDKGNQLHNVPYSLSVVSRQAENEAEFLDPYGTGTELKDRDIGVYKDLCAVDALSIDLKRKRNALFLFHKLKLLLAKLARVNLEGLSHQHKLAFWINTYNSCLMNAFLEHGIPDSPEKVVLLMREATIAVGGQTLNAITIEHFILRLPFYLKQGNKKAARGDELKASNMFGLECSEPLVTFALSCGSWSSPAVRVYTASQIESELEAAKREFLQAAVGISKSDKLVIPKLLEWYQLDFAKDFESMLDWVCLQLPDELRKEGLSCLERKSKQPPSNLVEVVPYDFNFRYLLHQ